MASDSISGLTLAAGAEPDARVMSAPTSAPVLRADAPGLPAQLAEILVSRAGQRTEIALKPDELGQVRMSLTLSEHGATVTVSADRPETLDLMRRHAEQLAEALRALGHGSVSFSFGGNFEGDHAETARDPQGDPRGVGTGDDETGDAAVTQAASHPNGTPAGAGGLDIRL